MIYLSLLGSLVLISCEKNHVCVCKNTNKEDGSTHTSYINMEGKKNNAKSTCENLSADWSIQRKCKLENE